MMWAVPPPPRDDFATRFLRGDRDVLEQIYRDSFEAVRRAAGRVLREPADRDGVVQQVFTEVVSDRRLRATFRGGDLGAWLSGIARHKAIDFARRERRLTELSEIPEPAVAPGPLDDFRHELERFARRLPDDRRRLVELRFVAGMTQVEAAGALGIPRSTLEDWERQIKRALEEYLLSGEGKVA
jgi:RNA polymerase sigma-70 factor (ECF subfamily)